MLSSGSSAPSEVTTQTALNTHRAIPVAEGRRNCPAPTCTISQATPSTNTAAPVATAGWNPVTGVEPRPESLATNQSSEERVTSKANTKP